MTQICVAPPECVNTVVKAAHWSQDKIAHIFQMTYSNAFSSTKILKFNYDSLRFQGYNWYKVIIGPGNGLITDNDKQVTSHFMNQW